MWTNTEVRIPAVGSKGAVFGNNPVCNACPGPDGGPALQSDMAISQYAYGKLR